MIMKPVSSEKAVKMMDIDNTLLFEIPRRTRKEDLKKEIEKMFNVKVAKIRTLITQNKKFAYVRMDKKNPAVDIATKLGMI